MIFFEYVDFSVSHTMWTTYTLHLQETHASFCADVNGVLQLIWKLKYLHAGLLVIHIPTHQEETLNLRQIPVVCILFYSLNMAAEQRLKACALGLILSMTESAL